MACARTYVWELIIYVFNIFVGIIEEGNEEVETCEENCDEENKPAKENKLSDMDYLRSKVVTALQKSQKRKKSKKAKNVENDDSDIEESDRDGSDMESVGVHDDKYDSKGDGDGDDDDEEKEEQEQEGEEEGHNNNSNVIASTGKSKSPAVLGTIKMRGLPFKAREQHIKDFFSPLRILDIRIIKNKNGKPSGCAFVDFASENDIMEALKRDRDFIEGRYIELFRDKEERTNKEAIEEKPWMKKLANQGDDEEFESIAEVRMKDL